MFGTLSSPCVLYSWDEVFVQYRHNFHPPTENKTPEEDLHEIAIASGYAEAEAGADNAANSSSNPVADTVAAFMQSSIGCSNGPNLIHHSEVVTGFCRHPRSDLLRAKRGKGPRGERLVALVYEWENKPSGLKQRGLVTAPLTHVQLLVKLCGKRFVELKPTPDPGSQSKESTEIIDADRRLIYISDLDPLIISVLAKTTSCLEAGVIQRTIFKYLTARTSFEAHITARGFKTYSLELNISYFCLRRGGCPIRDQRLRWDGKGHLRETLCSPIDPETSLPCSINDSSRRYNIYETQLSISVTGIDHWRWTAWAFVDNWFDPEDAVSEYYEGEDGGVQPDPLAAGQVDVNPPERYPREYFLKVFEIRIREVEKEWNYILHVLQQDIQGIGANPLFTSAQSSFESKQGREKIRRLAAWNGDMLKLVGTLLQSLSRTLVAWEVFQKTDIGYFLYDDATGTRRPEQLLPSLRIIEKTFLHLHIIHEEMEQVRWSLEELGKGLARGERNHSTAVQQRTGEHIKLLTWVTIGWSPVVIATGMCSAQAGIFPFRNSITDFVGAVLVVGSLVGLTIAVLLSRHSNLVDWKTTPVRDHDADSKGPAVGDNTEKRQTQFPSRVFTRQLTGASKFSGKTLISRGLELSGLRHKPMGLSQTPQYGHSDVDSIPESSMTV